MLRLAGIVLIIAALARTGWSECYECDSYADGAHCGKTFVPEHVSKTACPRPLIHQAGAGAQAGSQAGSYPGQGGGAHAAGGANAGVDATLPTKETCYRAVATKGNEHYIFRGCGSCDYAKQQIEQDEGNFDYHDCKVCIGTLCNSAPRLLGGTTGVLLMLAPLAALMFTGRS